jgi:hypothetical protein
MYIHDWYQSTSQSFLYVHEYSLQYTWRIPLAFSLPLLISLCFPLLPFYPLVLTWNPPSCDRIRPPRSQACKLTSPVPTLSPKPSPLQIPRTPTAQRPTKTTSGIIRLLLSGTLTKNPYKKTNFA